MIAALMDQAAPWIALALSLGVAAAALGAALARSLFTLVMCLAAAGALGAGALMANGEGEAALALALYGFGLAPFILLAVLALTARAAKTRRRAPPWASALAALGASVVLLAAAPEFAASAIGEAADPRGASFWLAPLMAVAAIVCLGCLGLGERGAFTSDPAAGPERRR
jgi:hypothetical protein